MLDRLIERHDGAMVGAPGGLDTDECLFVFGLPRTGTTLVEQILSSHPTVFGAGELQAFATQAIQAVQRQARQAVGKLEFVDQAATLEPGALGRAYLEATRPQTGRTAHFVDKQPMHYLYAGLIRRGLPKARLVAVAREPMDACFAMYRTLFTNAYPFSYDLRGARCLLHGLASADAPLAGGVGGWAAGGAVRGSGEGARAHGAPLARALRPDLGPRPVCRSIGRHAAGDHRQRRAECDTRSIQLRWGSGAAIATAGAAADGLGAIGAAGRLAALTAHLLGLDPEVASERGGEGGRMPVPDGLGDPRHGQPLLAQELERVLHATADGQLERRLAEHGLEALLERGLVEAGRSRDLADGGRLGHFARPDLARRH